MEPYRIMVVDDSAFMRKIVSDLIEQDPSFKVEVTAKNGHEAVEQILTLSPDLVTMDVEMPDMNGLEALKVIMERHPLPVIMLSGINEQGTRETIMALELGAFDFIRKPSVSTSSHDIAQVGRELREQIAAAMLMKERRAAREAIEMRNRDTLPSPILHDLHDTVAPLDAKSKKTVIQNSPEIVIEPLETSDKSGLRAKANVDHKLPSLSSRIEVDGNASKVNPMLQEVRDSLGEIVAKRPEKEKLKKPLKEKPEQAEPHNKPTLPKLKSQLKPLSTEAVNVKKVIKEIVADRIVQPVINTSFTDLVAIGTSTGGPKALKAVLERIPHDFPAPIVIVQHMPANFTKSLAQRLNSLCPLNVVEAEEGMELNTGTAYIAPGGFHMNVCARGGRYSLTLSKQELRNGHRPSVDVMYESLLPLHSLKRHIVLLTGMGSDGAKVMKRLYDDGVTSTFAESEDTCVVYGMPRSAIELKCVSHVLPLHEIGPKLVQVVK